MNRSINNKSKSKKPSASKAQREKAISKNRAAMSRERTLSAPVAYSTRNSSSKPKIQTSLNSCRIVHRELLGNVVGTALFGITSNNTFALNPGMGSTFPWLSNQAAGWEKYRFNSLKFEYYTRCSTATPGSVILVPDYDPADIAPLTEVAASSYQDLQEDAPWKDICCKLNPLSMSDPKQHKFIRSAPLANNLDIKTYDSGTFFVGTVDGTAVNWGKVWVDYDVSFYVPQLGNIGGNESNAQHIDTNETEGAFPTSSSLFGSVFTSTGPQWVSVPGTGKILSFNATGLYFLALEQIATTSVTSTSLAVTGGASYNTSYSTNGYTLAGSATTQFLLNVLLNVASLPATLQINNSIVLGISGELVIIPVAVNFS